MKTLADPQSRDEIARRIRTVRSDSPRRWGRMNAHQMICHLADSCRMAMGDKTVSDASSRLTRTVVKWMALYLPVRWRSGILTRPEIDQLCDGTRPVDFTRDRAELEALLERMIVESGTIKWPRHPIFGRLTRSQWLRWAYLHTDHHLRQFGV